MCCVRAKILVARKLGREQKRERSGAPLPPCSFSFFALASIFARPESLLARHIALRSPGIRERLLRRLAKDRTTGDNTYHNGFFYFYYLILSYNVSPSEVDIRLDTDPHKWPLTLISAILITPMNGG